MSDNSYVDACRWCDEHRAFHQLRSVGRLQDCISCPVSVTCAIPPGKERDEVVNCLTCPVAADCPVVDG